MPTARVQEADCSRFVPRLALAFPLRAFLGLYSSCSFLFISIYYLLSSSSCRIFIYFGSSFLFSFFFSSLLGSRSARLCALFCVRRPFGLLFLLDSSRIPPHVIERGSVECARGEGCAAGSSGASKSRLHARSTSLGSSGCRGSERGRMHSRRSSR